MTDYHQRFREEFYGKVWDIDKVLAFIDEIVAEERERTAKEYHHAGDVLGYSRGKRETRASLIEKVEGMRGSKKLRENSLISPLESHRLDDQEYGYNQALDDLLTWLRREEKDGPCEHSFVWCDECSTEPPQSGIQEETCPDQDGCAENPLSLPPFQTGAAFVGGFPEELLAGNSLQEETLGTAWELDIDESSGAAFSKPRTEETEKEKCCGISPGYVHFKDCPRLKGESEKEGASFSGREMRVYLVREDDLVKREKLHSDAGIRDETDWSGWIRQGDYEIARPKENTTPQSREQSTGWKHHPECIGHVGNTPGCYVTPEILKAAQRERSREQGGEKDV